MAKNTGIHIYVEREEFDLIEKAASLENRSISNYVQTHMVKMAKDAIKRQEIRDGNKERI